MFGTLGGPEVILILVVALIVFGPRRLPEIGKSMGKMLAEFRKASNDFKRTIEDELEAEKLKEASRPVAPVETPPVVTTPVETPPVVNAPVETPPVVTAPPEAPPAASAAPPVDVASPVSTASVETPPAASDPHLAPPEAAVVSRGPAPDQK
jgi:Tat protein translocase TatB subunit